MISYQVNISGPRAALALFARGVGDTTILNRQIGAKYFAWVEENFETQGAKGGKPWAPLKAGGRWKGKGKNRNFQTDYRILQDTGNLKQSFAQFFDANQAGVGARASFFPSKEGGKGDYATAHEEGDPSRNLPQRKMLMTPAVGLKIATDIYTLRINKLAQAAGLSA